MILRLLGAESGSRSPLVLIQPEAFRVSCQSRFGPRVPYGAGCVLENRTPGPRRLRTLTSTPELDSARHQGSRIHSLVRHPSSWTSRALSSPSHFEARNDGPECGPYLVDAS